MAWQPSYVREDGTFCIVIKFETTVNAADLRSQITDWCHQWVAENKEWHPSWLEEEPTIERGNWDYFAIFSGPPYVSKAENHQLWLSFEGTFSNWWRDWAARIVGGLMRGFPDLRKQTISFNCDEQGNEI